MGSLRGTEVGAFFLFTAISVFPAFGQDAATTPNAGAQRTGYPESADGLKSLITDLLAAIKSGDTLKSSQLLASLDLPNHREWFLKSFGVTEAPDLEAKYVELVAQAPDWLQKRLEGVSKHAETNVTVRVFQKPVEGSLRFYKAIADAMVTNFPIYEAIGGTDFLGDFVYMWTAASVISINRFYSPSVTLRPCASKSAETYKLLKWSTKFSPFTRRARNRIISRAPLLLTWSLGLMARYVSYP
jgi:hypothetical protein